MNDLDIPAMRSTSFNVIEQMLIKRFESTGTINRQPRQRHPNDAIYIGNMMIDLMILAENLELNITDCFVAAGTKLLVAHIDKEN